MARIITNSPFATTGIPIALSRRGRRQPDGSYHIQKDTAITLSNGLCLIADADWTGIRLNTPCLFLAEKLNSGAHRIGDLLLGTHYARLSRVILLNSQEGAGLDIDATLNNYMSSWKRLNDAERATFLSGAQAAVSGAVCGWQSTAFIMDCITPGGPLIPVFSGLLALTSGAMCVNGLQNMSAAANIAVQEAVKMQSYSADLNRLVVQLGGDNNTILFTPQIHTYCSWISSTCAGVETIARQTVGNIGLLFNSTPGLQLAA